MLGQSYGGFCAVHYLSAHPEGLREVFITGGLPPLACSADDYYRATYPVVRSKTRKHFARYPGDEALAARIMQHLHEREVTLPTGGRLTVRRFQQLGFLLGFDEGMETLHYLLESAFCEGANGAELSLPFLRDVENSQPFETNPIFAVLHEMCYTQQAASRWSAHRMRDEFPETNWAPGKPPAFTGEMIYPWMFDEYPALVPLREVAELLAQDAGWPMLYDPARLAANRVPAAAAIYAEDMYVPRVLLRAHRRGHRRHEGLAHQRVRAQRTSHRRRARVRAPRRSRPRPRMSTPGRPKPMLRLGGRRAAPREPCDRTCELSAARRAGR